MNSPWKRDIHMFQMKGEQFLVDANSGTVFQIEPLVWDYFTFLDSYSIQETRAKLAEKYGAIEANEAILELEEWKNIGWLFTNDQSVKEQMEELEPGVMKSLCLHIAHDCNLRCRYCFASTGDYQGKRGLMSKEVALAAVDFLLDQSPEMEKYLLDFFGGEPLLNFSVVRDTIEYAKDKGQELGKTFKFSLTTNATLLTSEIQDYLNSNDVEVILSLDGPPSAHDAMRPFPNGRGSQAVVLAKAKELVESRKGENCYVRGTFTALDPYFAKSLDYLVNEGFKNISLEPVVALPGEEYALTEKHLPILLAEYEKIVDYYLTDLGKEREFAFFHFDISLRQGPCLSRRIMGCGAGTEYLSISPEGDIYPCHQFMGREGFAMGNILEKDYSPQIGLSLRATHIYRKKCADCWARFFCSGGCHANAHLINGDISLPYELNCALEKKRLECIFYLQAKLEKPREQ